MVQLTATTRDRLIHWYPALLAGFTMWLTAIFIGSTPVLRATALAIVVVGISLSLRRLGVPLAYLGGVALGFSPAYWSQTGGPPTVNGWLILLFIVVAGVVAALILTTSKRVFMGFAVGISLFIGLYLVFGITQKSLRITTILAAWLLYMMIIAIRQTNPRPDEPAATPLSKPHVYGVLLMMTLGVLNDPLFTLFAPAVIIGLWLANTPLPRWYWPSLVIVTLYGGYGIANEYVSLDWLVRGAHDMHMAETFVPYIVADGWREPVRWLYLTQLIINQFTWIGVVLSVIGLARMARWYPTLGVTLMIAYAGYWLFGLMYFGKDIEILLLPMMMIQVISITYAVYALSQWGMRLSPRPTVAWVASWGIVAAFSTLHITLLLRIIGAN
ncbi:MAG: hypothetical protein AAF787_18575 [Chloroflexota bacterium]